MITSRKQTRQLPHIQMDSAVENNPPPDCPKFLFENGFRKGNVIPSAACEIIHEIIHFWNESQKTDCIRLSVVLQLIYSAACCGARGVCQGLGLFTGYIWARMPWIAL